MPKAFGLVTRLEFQKSNQDKSIQVKEFGEKFRLKGERINILYDVESKQERERKKWREKIRPHIGELLHETHETKNWIYEFNIYGTEL